MLIVGYTLEQISDFRSELGFCKGDFSNHKYYIDASENAQNACNRQIDSHHSKIARLAEKGRDQESCVFTAVS